jgi:hypothetical protein
VTRPQIVVNVAAALQRRGAPTDTGVAFVVFAGATGPSTPTECKSKADALAAAVPETQATWIGDILNQGAPKVWALRAAAVDATAVTEAEWTTALELLTGDFGPGQVLIPAVSSSAAHAALLDHAATFNRTVLLDSAKDDTAADIVTAATGLAAGEGAEKATILAGWSSLPGPAGVARDVPASVIAAGLVGRNDALIGHANNAPAGDQGRGAGVVNGALGQVTSYTDAELDDLHDAGVSVFRSIRGQVQLYGWVSLSSDARFRQLNWGRMAMQLQYGIGALVEKFLFRQIDGQGLLFAEVEGALRGYLKPLWTAAAFYGATADDAYDVDVAGVNTTETIIAGELHSAVAVSLSPHTEQVVVDVTTKVVEGVAA